MIAFTGFMSTLTSLVGARRRPPRGQLTDCRIDRRSTQLVLAVAVDRRVQVVEVPRFCGRMSQTWRVAGTKGRAPFPARRLPGVSRILKPKPLQLPQV